MTIWLTTIIKDEHRDIREWALHHRALGIDRIVLYDNDSTHGYDSELGDLDIEWHPWPGNREFRQRHVYEHFHQSREWCDDDWCLFIDADEFLHLDGYADVRQLVADYDPYAGVVLSWRCFGASGHLIRPLLPLREAFTEPVPPIRAYHNFKTLARLNELSFWADVHRIVPRSRALVTIRREPVLTSEVPQVLEGAWIDHYITKSWMEYVEKLKRGNITKGIRRVEHFFAYNPDLQPLAEELVSGLDFAQFPTLWNDRQRERIAQETALEQIANRLERLCFLPDEQFAIGCVLQLTACCELHMSWLEDDEERQRLQPYFIDLMQKEIAHLNTIPRSLPGYHDTVISSILATPFARIAREV